MAIVPKTSHYTTTTKLSRAWKKAFDENFKIVLCNDQDIGYIIWGEMYTAMRDSGIIDQIREELWEAHDPETQAVLQARKEWERSEMMSHEDFIKKYGYDV
jgi:hypothetical protein